MTVTREQIQAALGWYNNHQPPHSPYCNERGNDIDTDCPNDCPFHQNTIRTVLQSALGDASVPDNVIRQGSMIYNPHEYAIVDLRKGEDLIHSENVLKKTENVDMTPDTAALDALDEIEYDMKCTYHNIIPQHVAARFETIRAALMRPVGWMPIDLWHEDIGFAFWTRFPVVEPYYAGSPLCDDWHDDYYTHFIPMSVLPPAPPITIEGTEHDR